MLPGMTPFASSPPRKPNQNPHAPMIRNDRGEFNVEMRIGGDSGLSARGEEFARRTAEFVTWAERGGARFFYSFVFSV